MKSFLILTLSFLTCAAWALPEAHFDALSPERLAKHKMSNEDYDFEGIVKLSNCSGSLIIFSGMPLTAKAWVMTNGHCIQKPGGYLNPGEVWVNRPMSRAMKLFDSQMNLHPIMSSKILYATMTDTDVAYYELTETYEQIQANTGVRPLLLDGTHPLIGEEIEIISGYWDRGYSCAVDAFIFRMKEGPWTWTNSIRYTAGCDTIGGTSGSPLVAKADRRVIGINNTSNRDGAICTLNNPCEVNEHGQIFSSQGLRYGQQTFNVYACLAVDFNLDLSNPYCELPR